MQALLLYSTGKDDSKKGFQKAVNLSHAKMTLMERVKRDAVINQYSIGHVCHT